MQIIIFQIIEHQKFKFILSLPYLKKILNYYQFLLKLYYNSEELFHSYFIHCFQFRTKTNLFNIFSFKLFTNLHRQIDYKLPLIQAIQVNMKFLLISSLSIQKIHSSSCLILLLFKSFHWKLNFRILYICF